MKHKYSYKLISKEAAAYFFHKISKMNIMHAYIDRKSVINWFVVRNDVNKICISSSNNHETEL
jgi:hypothetical protein